MKKSVFHLFAVIVMAAVMSSCGDDPMPLPTVQLLADVDGYEVLLTVQSTDATTFAWDYGNGETATETGTHTYTYPASGDYTIRVTVTNESGTATATADITINPSIQEMLAGVDAAGKTWVITTEPQANDGAGPLHETEFNLTLPFALIPGGVDPLTYVGFPNEYDNEFTFKPDGSYSIDNVNGLNLCTAISAVMATGEMEPGGSWTMGNLGFATMAYSTEANASWAIEEGATIAMDVKSDDPSTANDYTDVSVNYQDVTKINITGGYFGILDVTNNVILESIAPDKMQVILLMHTEFPDKLSIFIRLTFVPKQ